jgi:zinc protease
MNFRNLTAAFVLSLAAFAQKTPPPAPSAPHAAEFPKPASKKLANGLNVYVIEDHRLPLVSASMQILAGGVSTPPAQAGLAGLTAGLLRQGTATRDAQQIARLVDGAGGSLDASAGDDVASVSMSFMKSKAALGFELMADITLHPAFAQAELERLVKNSLSGLAVSYADAEALAPLSAARAVLGTHPYAYPDEGTPETLRTLKREDVQAFYKKYYVPGRTWLAIAGDVTAAEGFALAEKYFGAWNGARADEAKPAAPPAPRQQVLIIDMPEAVQTQIVVAQLGVERNHPDYMALAVANQIFGGSFNSRLNMKLRANEGLTYGANSSFSAKRLTGMFEASTFTRTEKTAEAIRMLVELLKEYRKNPATEAEFAEAKAYLLGNFGLSTETAGAVAGRVLNAAIFGLGEDYYPTYRTRLQALTREQVVGAAERFFHPEKLSIIAVGNAKEFSKDLAAFGPTRVIKSTDVDFVADDLLKAKPKVSASPEGAAKARALINKAAAAMGGVEKLASVKDATLSGKLKLTMPQGSFDAETDEAVLYPDRHKLVMKLPMGVITQVYNAGEAWMAQGAQSQAMPPAYAKEMAKEVPAALGGLGMLLAAATGKANVQLLDEATVLWKMGDFEAKLGFDAASGRLVKLTFSTIGMSGPAEMETTFDGFTTEDGLTLPTKETSAQNGQKVGERTITARKLNSGLAVEAFQKK